MVTQRTTLQEQITEIEKILHNSVQSDDIFRQVRMYKKLEILKSTLLNLD